MILYCIIFRLLFFAAGIHGKCPPDSVARENKCYTFMSYPLPFAQAEAECNDLGGHLISVEDAFKNVFLAEGIKTEFENSEIHDIWIGGARNPLGKWEWTDKTPFSYTKFESENGGDCAALTINIGKWSSQDCTISKPYGCETNGIFDATHSTTTSEPSILTCPSGWIYDNLTTSCYYLTPNLVPWQDAEDYCQKYHAHLMSVQSEDIFSIVVPMQSRAMASMGPWTWMGLYNYGSYYNPEWRYVSNASNEYQLPFYSQGTSKCMCLLGAYGNGYRQVSSNVQCNELLHGICQLQLKA